RFKVLLSASVPSKDRPKEYLKIPNAQIHIEEAVIGLARNIFQAGGQLVFGGHPSISPLVAMVATEFNITQSAEDNIKRLEEQKPIKIFQSKAYEAVLPQETSTLYNQGIATFHWTNSVNGEKFDPSIKSEQCILSLESMRNEMIKEKYDAMICIGGMEGIEREFKMFMEYHRNTPIFLIKSTGGASLSLSERYLNNTSIRIFDGKDYKSDNSKIPSFGKEGLFPIPYSLITGIIVQEILLNSSNNKQ
ncbi:MAG TPA: hypothetical protein VN922_07900, partial [Bacteroidia bacterium]|nr:hypothetical protein [Bacteroidia bacterium]